jgi:hypothetical protein
VITIESKPAGADVFIGRKPQSRGKTPLTIELPKSGKRVTLTLKRSGYEDLPQQIIPSKPGRFVWNLARMREEQRPPRQRDGARPTPGIDDSLTLGPAI